MFLGQVVRHILAVKFERSKKTSVLLVKQTFSSIAYVCMLHIWPKVCIIVGFWYKCFVWTIFLATILGGIKGSSPLEPNVKWRYHNDVEKTLTINRQGKTVLQWNPTLKWCGDIIPSNFMYIIVHKDFENKSKVWVPKVLRVVHENFW